MNNSYNFLDFRDGWCVICLVYIEKHFMPIYKLSPSEFSSYGGLIPIEVLNPFAVLVVGGLIGGMMLWLEALYSLKMWLIYYFNLR